MYNKGIESEIRSFRFAGFARNRGWNIPGSDGNLSRFILKIAESEIDRIRALKLAFKAYRLKGYIGKKSNPVLMENYDQNSSTRILAISKFGKEVGTVSEVFDGKTGLPSDSLFPQEINELRKNGRRLVEVVRFAICPQNQLNPFIKTRLLNFVLMDSLLNKEADDLIAEVNPGHVGFYKRLLGFEKLCSPRPCPRVSGAPAVLMRLQRELFQKWYSALGQDENEVDKKRIPFLYKRFLSWEQSSAALRFLRSN